MLLGLPVPLVPQLVGLSVQVIANLDKLCHSGWLGADVDQGFPELIIEASSEGRPF